MAKEWRNWAGDQRCLPARIERPASRGELVESVKRAADAGLTVRAAGSGHSFTDIACTGGVLLDLERLDRVLEVDREAGPVKVEAGIDLRDMNEAIWGYGLALENLGDIDKQTAAGAVSTATHGTGSRFRNLSSQIEAVELVLPDGTLMEISTEHDPDLLPAARVGLGALGVIATLTFRAIPAFTIRRLDSPLPLEETLEPARRPRRRLGPLRVLRLPPHRRGLLRQSERTDEPPKPRNRALEYGQEVVLENWVMGAIARARPADAPAGSRRSRASCPRSSAGAPSWIAATASSPASAASVSRRWSTRSPPARRRGVPRVLEAAEAADPPVGFPIEVRFVAGDERG